jgi:ATP-dependent Lon protease
MSDVRQKRRSLRIPETLPVLPLRDVVVFPNIIAPLSVSRSTSIQAVEEALHGNRIILLVSQLDRDCESPGEGDLYAVGTAGLVIKTLKLPDDRMRVLVQGLARVRIHGFDRDAPHLTARVEPLHEAEGATSSLQSEALLRNVRKLMEDASSLGKGISSEVLVIAQNLDDPGRLADLAASNLELKVPDAQSVLETLEPVGRLKLVNEIVSREIEVLHVQAEISTAARGEMDRSQREYLLRQQLKAIHGELGDHDVSEEADQFRQKARAAGMPAHALEELDRQCKRLERMPGESPEATTIRTHLELMVALPWTKATEDSLDVANVARVLAEDHFGLDQTKDRILEYMAVRKLRGDARGPILCLAGPPGVGKTSIVRSIARAMGRRFQRVSLGGVRDEAEIRGHRRTYVGAMPGRIIQAIQQAGSVNPVILLDEVDKLGSDHRGDPSAALLEVLDPEQNRAFRDHYLGVEYDLSKVLFICTANMLEPIHPAFRDRMEILKLSGYTPEEKREIAKRHLLPRQLEENGLHAGDVTLSDNAIDAIVSCWTHEAGLRTLERRIAQICRKVARRHAEGDDGRARVTETGLQRYLGTPPTMPERALTADRVGVATGLAVTSAGGDVLFVEALVLPGSGQLILTGSLGDVMKESARAALSFVHAHGEELGIPAEMFRRWDMHVHLPEGATPKDGPSAGITLICAMVSALTGIPLRHDVAMTGEVTLRGSLLPVGGIRDKMLAARRAGITHVILAEANRKDIADVPAEARKGLEFHPCEDVLDALACALSETPRPRGKALPVADPTPDLTPEPETVGVG